MMGRMAGRLRLVQRRPFCTTTNPKDNRPDAYKQLDNLDFMTAAKILFTTPPKKKQFGIDFHLVQLFFVCMPSLAVYLVAQYARHEMRRMEAELEVKKRSEEEAKAKEMEIKAAEEKEAGLDPELIDVKERLGKLEDALKEIVVESKKQSGSIIAENKEGGNNEGKKTSTIESNTTQNRSKSSDSEDKDPDSKQTPIADAPKQDQQATQDEKK